MERSILHAPAKVNLRLEILGTRPDGYHDVRTWMWPISLGDTVTVERTKSPGIFLQTTRPGIPSGEDNLAYRAAALFLERTGASGGISIEIEKRIPVAAGLGGGSTDAAAVLRGMHALWSPGLAAEDLADMGADLGADVPFFVRGKPALMDQKGERFVTFLPPMMLWLLLVNPGVPLRTADVYAAGKWGLTKNREGTTIAVLPQDPELMGEFVRNDLESPATELMPVIAEMRRRVTALGAQGVVMSGSGPSVCGLFRSRREARRAATHLTMEPGWLSRVVHTIIDT